jgi:ethanolamine kinase
LIQRKLLFVASNEKALVLALTPLLLTAMSPKAYIAARQDAENRADHHVMVDSKPYFPFLVANGGDLDSIRQVVAKILQVSYPSAVVKDVETWPVTVVCGGITNQLFRVDILSSCDEDPDKVETMPKGMLVRIFGAEGMIDRDVENSTYAALAAQGIAPAPYYGRFANGRLEGWLEEMIPLTVREMADPLLSPQIAIQMARLHALFHTPLHLEEYYHQPSLWSQLQDWTTLAISATFPNEADAQRAKTMITPLLANLPAEISWLRQQVVPSDAPVAFCHNDALAANILHNPSTGQVRLIDFEYGGVNYKAFDIANHFNEFAGGTQDGVTNYDWFPTREHQLLFLRAYLQLADEPNEATLQEWYDQVQAFLLVNHLYWGTWAVNQAAREGCEGFDFLLFAHNRLSRYFECKKAQACPSS